MKIRIIISIFYFKKNNENEQNTKTNHKKKHTKKRTPKHNQKTKKLKITKIKMTKKSHQKTFLKKKNSHIF